MAELAYVEGKELVDGAQPYYQRVSELITALRALDDDAAFEARFHALRDHVEQHMEDEETAMFSQAAQVLETHLEEITIRLQERKEQILAS